MLSRFEAALNAFLVFFRSALFAECRFQFKENNGDGGAQFVGSIRSEAALFLKSQMKPLEGAVQGAA